MDSTAYKYLILDIQRTPAQSLSALPLVLARSQVCHSKESLAGVKQFLGAAAGNSTQDYRVRLPAILGLAHNAFASLFLEAHKALLEVLDGADPSMHPFRHSGSTLMRLLCFYAQNDLAATGLSTDVAAASMYCFLIEGMIHAGWCPNASEVVAKRSAHTCFLALRKSMHKLAADEHASVLGYLWSAWILSQKTEGILDSGEGHVAPSVEALDWESGGKTHSYLAQRTAAPALSSFLNRNATGIVHPFTRFALDGVLGLHLLAGGETVSPLLSPEVSDIVRPKMAGVKFVYGCATSGGISIKWTVVILTLECTTYRIDILALSPNSTSIDLRGEFRLENELALAAYGPDAYLGEGSRNAVVRFPENPMGFQYARQEEGGISVFESQTTRLSSARSLQGVCAWARGKGITTINETRLLGIFDQDELAR
jgi:hypothetical protein